MVAEEGRISDNNTFTIPCWVRVVPRLPAEANCKTEYQGQQDQGYYNEYGAGYLSTEAQVLSVLWHDTIKDDECSFFDT